MDAVEFFKEAKRYCKWCKNTTQDGKKRLCDVCYFGKLNDIFNLHPMAYCKFVETVEQWAKEHPVKTRQSEFLKMLPNARLDATGCLMLCPMDVMGREYVSKNIPGCINNGIICGKCKRDFWLKEIE